MTELVCYAIMKQIRLTIANLPVVHLPAASEAHVTVAGRRCKFKTNRLCTIQSRALSSCHYLWTAVLRLGEPSGQQDPVKTS